MTFITATVLSMSILLPLVAGLLVKNKSILLKKFITFLGVGFLFEIILIITSFIGNNLFYFNVYTLIEIGLISVIFTELIKGNFLKSIIWITSVILIIQGVLGLKFDVIDSVTKSYESIFVIACAILYYFNSFNDNKVNLGQYILASGLLLFFSTTLIIFLMSESMINIDPEKYKYFYTIHTLINFGVNLMYFFGILSLKIDDETYLHSLKKKAVDEYIFMTTPSKKDMKW